MALKASEQLLYFYPAKTFIKSKNKNLGGGKFCPAAICAVPSPRAAVPPRQARGDLRLGQFDLEQFGIIWNNLDFGFLFFIFNF